MFFVTFIDEKCFKVEIKHVSKNDQDSLTGHTTIPARPSDFFGDFGVRLCGDLELSDRG